MFELILMQVSIFFGPVILLFCWELLLPARQITYLYQLTEIFKFTGVTFIFNLLVNMGFLYFSQLAIVFLLKTNLESLGINSIPLWLRLFAAYFLTDFTYYCFHRFQHSNAIFWKTHKFHHSTEKIWSLSGRRGSFTNVLLNSVVSLWFAIFAISPEVMFVVAIHLSFHTYWQHLNVKGQKWMKFIEWIYVTPRYHHIHHLSRQELQCKNLGMYFTCFDRFFGTYVNPDELDNSEEMYGLGEEYPITTSMIIGI